MHQPDPSDPPATIGHNAPPPTTLDDLLASLRNALKPDQLAVDLQSANEDVVKRAGALLEAVPRFLAILVEGAIPNDTEYGRAGDFHKQIGDVIKAVDHRRTAIKEPVLLAERMIDAFFANAATKPLSDARQTINGHITRYAQRKAQEAREEQARQARLAAEAAARAAEAAKAAAEEGPAADDQAAIDAAIAAEEAMMATAAAPPPSEAAKVTSSLGTTVHMRKGPWRVRITDPAAIPRAFLMPNEAALLAQAKTDPRIAEGVQPIPGVEFYRDSKAATR